MDFERIVATAIEQDSRNKFEKYDGSLDKVPDEFKSFYREHNPVDVEIASAVGDIRLYPAEELATLQSGYAYLNARFVFASTNGDPIFFDNGQVFTCPHGMSKPKWEELSDPLFQVGILTNTP